MKKMIIFDLDGTVGDTVGSLAYTVNKCLTQLGFPTLPEENFNYYAGDGARVLLERSLYDAGDKKRAHLDELLELYWEEFKTGCTRNVSSYPGLPEVLKSLKSRGFILTVCTNKAQPYAEAVIREIYGDGLFDFILGEQPGIPRKPDPAGPLLIAKKFGVSSDQCIYVGDTNTDMKTGAAARMYTIGVTWGYRPREELEAFSPDRIVDKPQQLLLEILPSQEIKN